jgi:FAD/FMN-containing dehydrogenase
MSTSAVLTEQERPASAVETKIRALDSRLDDLRARRKKAEAELTRLTREENRMIRDFADATFREKSDIRGRLDGLAGDRTNQEREMAGLAAAIVEVEEERAKLLPEFERAWTEQAKRDRQKKLDELHREHDKNLAVVRAADKALLVAREAADKSFFALTAFKDQEAVTERLAAQERLKAEWQRYAGPNAGRR